MIVVTVAGIVGSEAGIEDDSDGSSDGEGEERGIVELQVACVGLNGANGAFKDRIYRQEKDNIKNVNMHTQKI